MSLCPFCCPRCPGLAGIRNIRVAAKPTSRGNLEPGPWPPASPSLEERWPRDSQSDISEEVRRGHRLCCDPGCGCFSKPQSPYLTHGFSVPREHHQKKVQDVKSARRISEVVKITKSKFKTTGSGVGCGVHSLSASPILSLTRWG